MSGTPRAAGGSADSADASSLPRAAGRPTAFDTDLVRRRMLIAGIAAPLAAALPGCATLDGDTPMYGLIGKMRAAPGQRDALVAILLESVHGMPGCLSYVVAADPTDADGIWITEVWNSADSHKASLSLPAVRDAITRAKPLIAGFDQHIETLPLGGHGLTRAG
ncbi:putative quinol monooxygenase [Marilutibacter chinensis]|uniref:Antibiotic biosynthesis monooxygenase n=1 Tax=Marilutibacter chinensis TaxID=2912247 RepID=A0ABS9HPZ5_9GAMM|nr:putative quinol monooxygenase [Lysobacter chinensis]MCF7220177.1 antibiotic biosynthesis monooxygenase [Lysobacter chinensis]